MCQTKCGNEYRAAVPDGYPATIFDMPIETSDAQTNALAVLLPPDKRTYPWHRYRLKRPPVPPTLEQMPVREKRPKVNKQAREFYRPKVPNRRLI